MAASARGIGKLVVVIRDSESIGSKPVSCVVSDDGGDDSLFDGLLIHYTASISAIFE